MLQRTAQSDFNSHAALLVGVDQVAHRSVDTRERSSLSRPHDDLHGLGKALVFLLHFAQQPDAV